MKEVWGVSECIKYIYRYICVCVHSLECRFLAKNLYRMQTKKKIECLGFSKHHVNTLTLAPSSSLFRASSATSVIASFGFLVFYDFFFYSSCSSHQHSIIIIIQPMYINYLCKKPTGTESLWTG